MKGKPPMAVAPWDDDDPRDEYEFDPPDEPDRDDIRSFLFRSGTIRKVQTGPDPENDTRLFIVL